MENKMKKTLKKYHAHIPVTGFGGEVIVEAYSKAEAKELVSDAIHEFSGIDNIDDEDETETLMFSLNHDHFDDDDMWFE
jgi:hypothetical protein